jgi:23S rRNA pseudouridine1911/1915/1917 synthase
MASLGHPIVGDSLYGAPKELKLTGSGKSPHARRSTHPRQSSMGSLPRNFLHAARLELAHPRTGQTISLESRITTELQDFLALLEKTAVSETAS